MAERPGEYEVPVALKVDGQWHEIGTLTVPLTWDGDRIALGDLKNAVVEAFRAAALSD